MRKSQIPLCYSIKIREELPGKNEYFCLMDFSQIIGQEHIKAHLKTTAKAGRIPHAQLFSGINGSGLLPMAIAYASEILALQYEEGSQGYENCKRRVSELNHPDIHFFYPVNTTSKIKDKPVSDHFSDEWRKFVLTNPYGSLFEWLQTLGIENKQGNISRREANNISRKLSLKSHDGGYKVAIIWMAENMGNECANAILKLIEEPTEKTLLLLLAEREEKLLTTITSRCQKITFPLLPETEIGEKLISDLKLDESRAFQISRRAQGDYNKALQLATETDEDMLFETWFIRMARVAFMAKKDKKEILNVLDLSDELAGIGREKQKKFLSFSLEIIRQALLQNYATEELVYYKTNDRSFRFDLFSGHIHHNNIMGFYEALEDAAYHIERNANAKILFTNLIIKFTHLFHTRQ